MQRLLLTLRYDGTAYHGWQVQPNAVTVQQTLQDAIEAVTGVRAGVTGCSRTDAGVHADMFCCCFDTASPLRGISWPAPSIFTCRRYRRVRSAAGGGGFPSAV